MKLLSDQVDEREVEIILRELARTRDVEGDVVELGCYVGTTSVHLAAKLAGTGKKLYLYDSFEGLPPKTEQDLSPAGIQFKTGELSTTKSTLINNLKKSGAPMPQIKKGWFKDLKASDLPEKISFAFLDGDYYESIHDSLIVVWPKLTPDAIIIVDDYANEALPGAAKATDEWLRLHPAKIQIEHSLAIIRPN